MIEFLSQKMMYFLIENNAIKKEEIEIYNYTFETVIAFLINIIFILLIGWIMNRFICTILFFVFYCPIRQFSGGYHAENYKSCLLTFVAIYILNYVILENFFINKNSILFLLITIISFIRVYKKSPFEHREHSLSMNQRKKYKQIVFLGLTLDLIISIIGIHFKSIYVYSIYILSVINIIYLMIILGSIKQKITEKSQKFI